jgi:hypothetical protein
LKSPEKKLARKRLVLANFVQSSSFEVSENPISQ